MIKKRIFAGLLCAFTSSSVFSNAPKPFNGFYAGAELGSSFAHANESINNTVNLNFDGSLFRSQEPFALSTGMSKNSLIATLFGGYARTWDNLYLGGEVLLSDADYKMTNSVNTAMARKIENIATVAGYETVYSETSASPIQFGVLLRPGILITPTSLFYGQIGASIASVKFNTITSATKIFTEGASTFASPITLQARKSIHRAAFQVGTGLEQAINEKWTLRINYLYSYYGTMHTQSEASNAAPNLFLLNANGAQSVSINDQSVKLGLAYHFNA